LRKCAGKSLSARIEREFAEFCVREIKRSIEYSSKGAGGDSVRDLRRWGISVRGGNGIFGIWKATMRMGSR
jgi:hypothetical protein